MINEQRESGFDLSFDELPHTMPIFPLTSALLLPQGFLPLNIFEPRYINMITDCLGNDRMFAMIQPRIANSEIDDNKLPKLYTVACAGRIVRFEENNNRQIEIAMKGICRFNLGEIIPTTRGYYRAMCHFDGYQHDMELEELDIQRKSLIDKLSGYLDSRNSSADIQALEQIDDQRLVNLIAMMCPFEPIERQALLEAKNLAERAEILITLLDINIGGGFKGSA